MKNRDRNSKDVYKRQGECRSVEVFVAILPCSHYTSVSYTHLINRNGIILHQFVSDRQHMKFNMLMCWCIGKAASGIKEFYMLPVGDKLMGPFLNWKN